MNAVTVNRMNLIYREVARLVAIEARVAAMQAMNETRMSRGESHAYGEASFFEESEKADHVTERLGMLEPLNVASESQG